MFGSRVTAPSAVVQPKAPGTPDADWQDEPIGPDDLTIRTPDGTVAAPESWLALVYSALREPGGFLNVCSGPPDLYAQAINHEGHVVLEYRDGAPERHFLGQGRPPTRSRRRSLAVDERRSTIHGGPRVAAGFALRLWSRQSAELESAAYGARNF